MPSATRQKLVILRQVAMQLPTWWDGRSKHASAPPAAGHGRARRRATVPGGALPSQVGHHYCPKGQVGLAGRHLGRSYGHFHARVLNLAPITACLAPTYWLSGASRYDAFSGYRMSLAKAAHYRAYAAASLANAEAAVDRTTRDVHLTIAQHFYSLAEDEISRADQHQPCSGSAVDHLDRSLAHVEP
jgi:hypothetical protein